jgi:NAD(P)H dehydrogenase (quinone)
MQVLVIYYSKSGNTKRLVEEVVKGVQQVNGMGCVLKSVSEVNKDDFVNQGGSNLCATLRSQNRINN